MDGLSGGIGNATALALGRLGCSIAIHYHSAEAKAKELASELEGFPGVKAAAFQADLSNYDGVRKLHADVVQGLGHPDILFNNAGVLNNVIGPNGNIQDVSVESFEETWRTNTGTAFLVS
jgi:3-oxoacyl-[acyl-carrier protein] reductase